MGITSVLLDTHIFLWWLFNDPLWITKAGFRPLAISPEHSQLAGNWDILHRDPFDRMLAAQAKIEKMPLATVDKVMEIFSVDLFPPRGPN